MTETSESADPPESESRQSRPRKVESDSADAEPDRNTDETTAENATRSDGDTGQDAVVPEPMSTPVLSGQIEREHAAFVVLGALATVAVFLQLSGVWL